MNAKSFVALAAVTVVVSTAAVVVLAEHQGISGGQKYDAPVIPGLLDKANDVSKIVVKDAEKTITVERKDKGWVVADKADYPAREDRVRSLVQSLAMLRLSEPKTRKKDRYARLELQPLDAKDAKSRRVELMAGDKKLADMLIGKSRDTGGGKGAAGVYVRMPDEDQAWLALGEVSAKADPLTWMQAKIADVKESRTREIHLVPKDGQQVIVVQDEPTGKTFKLGNPPEGAKLGKDADGKLKNLADAFDILEFVDVRSASELDFANPDLSITLTTFDGLILDLAGVRDGDTMWFIVDALKDDAIVPPAPKEGEKTVDVMTEASEIQAKTRGWAFKFSDYRMKNLSLTMADLIEK